MPEVKHNGCYYCGSRSEPILKSVVKRVIHKNGREDSGQPVALCSICFKADVIDLRVSPVRE